MHRPLSSLHQHVSNARREGSLGISSGGVAEAANTQLGTGPADSLLEVDAARIRLELHLNAWHPGTKAKSHAGEAVGDRPEFIL